jgi:hypothetical protein
LWAGTAAVDDDNDDATTDPEDGDECYRNSWRNGPWCDE